MIALWIILHSKRKYGSENAVADSEAEQKPFDCLFAFVIINRNNEQSWPNSVLPVLCCDHFSFPLTRVRLKSNFEIFEIKVFLRSKFLEFVLCENK